MPQTRPPSAVAAKRYLSKRLRASELPASASPTGTPFIILNQVSGPGTAACGTSKRPRIARHRAVVGFTVAKPKPQLDGRGSDTHQPMNAAAAIVAAANPAT